MRRRCAPGAAPQPKPRLCRRRAAGQELPLRRVLLCLGDDVPLRVLPTRRVQPPALPQRQPDRNVGHGRSRDRRLAAQRGGFRRLALANRGRMLGRRARPRAAEGDQRSFGRLRVYRLSHPFPAAGSYSAVQAHPRCGADLCRCCMCFENERVRALHSGAARATGHLLTRNAYASVRALACPRTAQGLRGCPSRFCTAAKPAPKKLLGTVPPTNNNGNNIHAVGDKE